MGLNWETYVMRNYGPTYEYIPKFAKEYAKTRNKSNCEDCFNWERCNEICRCNSAEYDKNTPYFYKPGAVYDKLGNDCVGRIDSALMDMSEEKRAKIMKQYGFKGEV